ncbi:hypothetical protein GOBAR_DD33027 [Gossypium barbadense]|nr:hypothetical protein GOBAR_DD33027 [Gossypium barbadense]
MVKTKEDENVAMTMLLSLGRNNVVVEETATAPTVHGELLEASEMSTVHAEATVAPSDHAEDAKASTVHAKDAEVLTVHAKVAEAPTIHAEAAEAPIIEEALWQTLKKAGANGMIRCDVNRELNELRAELKSDITQIKETLGEITESLR